MNIFIICTVRNATEEYKKQLEDYVSKLEIEGHKVHLPHRDTNQQGSGIDICKQNRKAIELSDEVHLFYSAESQGTHFDMGVAFALRKTIKVIKNIELTQGKSFARMAIEWQDIGAQ